MNVHKIRGVPVEVCTAEQKIAYNLAWANADYVKRAGFESIGAASYKLIDFYKSGHDYKDGKYNVDAIFCALNAGLIEYIKNPFIASSYEQINKQFPLEYDKAVRA